MTFDLVADLGRILQFAGRQRALFAAAEFDERLVAPQGDDAAALPRIGLQGAFLRGRLPARHHIVERNAGHGAVQLGFHGGAELLPLAGNHRRVVVAGDRRMNDNFGQRLGRRKLNVRNRRGHDRRGFSSHDRRGGRRYGWLSRRRRY